MRNEMPKYIFYHFPQNKNALRPAEAAPRNAAALCAPGRPTSAARLLSRGSPKRSFSIRKTTRETKSFRDHISRSRANLEARPYPLKSPRSQLHFSYHDVGSIRIGSRDMATKRIDLPSLFSVVSANLETRRRFSSRVFLQQCFTRGAVQSIGCLLYTSPSPRDATLSRMPSSA